MREGSPWTRSRTRRRSTRRQRRWRFTIHDFYATNLPARKILERHTGVEELKRIFGDVVATGRRLGVALPRLTELEPAVEAWTGQPAGASGEPSRGQPVTADA